MERRDLPGIPVYPAPIPELGPPPSRLRRLYWWLRFDWEFNWPIRKRRDG